MIIVWIVMFTPPEIINYTQKKYLKFIYDTNDDILLLLYGLTFISIYIKIGIRKTSNDLDSDISGNIKYEIDDSTAILKKSPKHFFKKIDQSENSLQSISKVSIYKNKDI
jgi:hypothetical protein